MLRFVSLVLVSLAVALPAGSQQERAGKSIAGILDEIKAQMVDIPAGEFRMGGNKYTGEQPVHAVTLRAFRLSKYEVTMAQYDVFAGATGRPLPDDAGWGRRNRPAIYVSLDDANAFAAWLSLQTGLKFRLPSESEWEYAARAGETAEYLWGKSFDPVQVNFERKVGKTTIVGSYRANRFGLHDMIGNVREWTADCFNTTHAGAPNDGSVRTSCDTAAHVIRGASWSDDSSQLPITIRYWDFSGYRGNFLGFRLAQDF